MQFSLHYFEKLKRELESAGYEITVDRQLTAGTRPQLDILVSATF